MVARPLDPGGHLLVGEVRRKGEVTAHRPLGRAERCTPRHRAQRLEAGLVELDPDALSEQAREHVAVHERAQAAEHRLDLDTRRLRDEPAEPCLVLFAVLGHLHGPIQATRSPQRHATWVLDGPWAGGTRRTSGHRERIRPPPGHRERTRPLPGNRGDNRPPPGYWGAGGNCVTDRRVRSVTQSRAQAQWVGVAGSAAALRCRWPRAGCGLWVMRGGATGSAAGGRHDERVLSVSVFCR